MGISESFHKEIKEMSYERLAARLYNLLDVDPDEEDLIQDFKKLDSEIIAIEAEMEIRKQSGYLK